MNVLKTDRSDRPKMIQATLPDPVPGKRELLVKIKATALNRADLLQKAGKYPPPDGVSPILGLEMAGVVEQVGDDASRFEPGDPVFGLLPGGGYAEYCVIREKMAMRIPESLTFEEAAAIPEVFLTAWQSLVWLGSIKEKERVLIHAGASGVGSAAIQLADRLFHSTIAATAGSDEKLETCAKLGAAALINYHREDFARVLSGKFGENSMDLVIDMIGAPYWAQNMDCLALDGRLVYLSMLGGAKIDRVSLVPVLRKRLTIKGSTLRNRTDEYKETLTSEFASQTLPLFSEKKLQPVIDSIFDWTDVEKAHERMENNLNTGKVVLNGM